MTRALKLTCALRTLPRMSASRRHIRCLVSRRFRSPALVFQSACLNSGMLDLPYKRPMSGPTGNPQGYDFLVDAGTWTRRLQCIRRGAWQSPESRRHRSSCRRQGELLPILASPEVPSPHQEHHQPLVAPSQEKNNLKF